MRRKILKIGLFILIISIFLVISVPTILISGLGKELAYVFHIKGDSEYELIDSGISYKESLDLSDTNSERGFYTTNILYMKPEGSTPVNFPSNGFVQLKIDISSFSGAQNKTGDIEFTQSALDALDSSLATAKAKNTSVILRFVYDANCDGIKDTEGQSDGTGRYVEPAIGMVERHINQLGYIFKKYDTTIYNIQMGFWGAYGELHSTTKCTQENFNRTIDALLRNTSKNITISVRTPGQYASWAGVDIDNIDQNITNPNENAYRVGMFNDGYLGSYSDLGSFKNREKALTWLNKQAKHVPYGGEAVQNYENSGTSEGSTALNEYSALPYCEEEMYRTHTSYLNSEWDLKLLREWQATPYYGSDVLYRVSKRADGQAFSQYDFINSHLGYRFVIRSSELQNKTTQYGEFKCKIIFENVGFSPVIKDKKVRLIFENKNNPSERYKTLVNLNIKDFESRELNEVEINAKLPTTLTQGKYKVYIQMYSEELQDGTIYLPIQIANDGIWNDSIKANFVGETTVTEIKNMKKGDFNEDGKITATDLSTINQLLLETIPMNDKYKIIGDMDDNSKITITDLSELKHLLLQ